jgi:hypothetical protein
LCGVTQEAFLFQKKKRLRKKKAWERSKGQGLGQPFSFSKEKRWRKRKVVKHPVA